ncbi:DUF6093 family protein [Zhihengliuella sp.]|uniref:DUF6093 family protein n=1 Tax=Zhihengliuella sp. TaxID=1954483 RepID=UPI002810CA60|nr:DUF6093 family protein [Zhihengliuella sp.]
MRPYNPDAIAKGQAAALESMRESCTIARLTGNTVTDPETWKDVPETTPVPSLGRCRVKTQTALVSDDNDGGEHAFTVSKPELVLPLPDPATGKDMFQPGDLVTITTPPPADGRWGVLPGTVYRLTEPTDGTFVTAQRWKARRVIA